MRAFLFSGGVGCSNIFLCRLICRLLKYKCYVLILHLSSCLMVVRHFFMIIQFRVAYLIKGECSEHSTSSKENQILFRFSMNKTGCVSSY